jgi:hypothetical protein
MTICQRCHRPLKNPAINGMGPVCAKTAAPVVEVERDLFGYDIGAAVAVAQARQSAWLDARVAQELREVEQAFLDAWAWWEDRG